MVKGTLFSSGQATCISRRSLITVLGGVFTKRRSSPQSSAQCFLDTLAMAPRYFGDSVHETNFHGALGDGELRNTEREDCLLPVASSRQNGRASCCRTSFHYYQSGLGRCVFITSQMGKGGNLAGSIFMNFFPNIAWGW